MRRFFHHKVVTTRDRPPSDGSPGARTRPGSSSPSQGSTPPPTPTGRSRVAHPAALRSRSMSVLSNMTDTASERRKRFKTSSFSFAGEEPSPPTPTRKVLTQSEEDEMFSVYTRRVYIAFGLLVAVITGFAVYAFVYNTGKHNTK